ncbi:hypothetical protein [Bacillus canaveralius]|uniref:hypothetical protein n=1 Tax=Bacillus canaveralius TaxID=1403243 RepID=UPI001FEB7E41|nr:hypothetical protein [Bacillus canaveralius]
MEKNKLKEKIKKNEPVFGMFVSIPHPIMVELIGHAEFDFVIIDYEHTSTNMETLKIWSVLPSWWGLRRLSVFQKLTGSKF